MRIATNTIAAEIDIPGGNRECITAVNPLHSLQRTDDDGDLGVIDTTLEHTGSQGAEYRAVWNAALPAMCWS